MGLIGQLLDTMRPGNELPKPTLPKPMRSAMPERLRV
jgi:hypothetical protein